VPRVERRADVVWEGNVARGKGTISGESGALHDLEVSLPTRVGEAQGHTSPEELIAAAHAACYAMALSNELSGAGHEPERLDVSANVVLDEVGDAHRITMIELVVRGRVPGLGEGEFATFVRAADEGCPVSNVLRAGAEISLDARLEATG
jgi:osmotically inducible protein OsmC